jgi:hypothetical protein
VVLVGAGLQDAEGLHAKAFVDRPDEVMVNLVVVSIGLNHGGRTRWENKGGGQSKLTKKGQEIPINFDVEKIVERTKKGRKVGNLMSMVGAK